MTYICLTMGINNTTQERMEAIKIVDSTEFIKYLNEPNSISLNDIMQLENITKKHPFFQIGYSLIAKGIYTKAPEISDGAIKKAAIYALSRNALRKVIENEIDWVNSSTFKFTEKKVEKVEAVEEFYQEKFEDELIASIAGGKIKNIQDEQLTIIDNFIKNEPRISQVRLLEKEADIEDLSEESTRLQEPLITESYAKILVRQGKFLDAINVYKQLISINPEKSTYFAAKIEELNKKLLSL